MPKPGNPQDFNRYAYVNNNPVNRTDPTGHFPNTGPIRCNCAVNWAGRTLLSQQARLALDVATIAVAGGAVASNQAAANQSGAGVPPANSDQAAGQTAGPGGIDPNSDEGRELLMRQHLAKSYDQVYGTSDDAIRATLGINGKSADFVGYNAGANRWMIAESKGGRLDTAVAQLRNTTRALLGKEPSAAGHIDLRIYTKSDIYQQLLSKDGYFGYRMRDGFLGYIDDLSGQWVYEKINGIRIAVKPPASP